MRAFGDQPADARAADDEVLVAHRIDLIGAKPVALPQRAQQAEVAAAAVAEQEVRADPHFRDTQPVDEHRAHERLGIPLRQLVREPHDRHARNPGPMQRLEPLRLGHQQRRRLVGPDDPRRMRVEGHRHRRAAVLGGAALDALDDLEMPAVQAVEVAERQHRMHQPRRPRVVREVDGLHSLHVDAHVEHQPIICQFDARGQARAGRGVAEIVRHVRQCRRGAA